MILRLKRTPGLYLVGFMGSGKSTIGRMLADRIGWHFADLDEDIEAAENTTIAGLFASRGEEAFRRIEHEALVKRVRKIQTGFPIVLALGGGAFTRPENVELMRANGVSIWIDAALHIVQRRVAQGTHRPLARDPVKFEQLFHERRVLYAQADYRIELHRDDSRIALQEALKLPIFQE